MPFLFRNLAEDIGLKKPPDVNQEIEVSVLSEFVNELLLICIVARVLHVSLRGRIDQLLFASRGILQRLVNIGRMPPLM